MTPQEQQSAGIEAAQHAAEMNRLRRLATLRRSGIKANEIFTTRQAANAWKASMMTAKDILRSIEADGMISSSEVNFGHVAVRVWLIRSKKR